jgi:dipeptidyl aminopeptidase/acylaminoacyl peptidase
LHRHNRSIGYGVDSDCVLGGGCTAKVWADEFYFTCLDGYQCDVQRLDLLTGVVEKRTAGGGSLEMFDIANDVFVAVGQLDGRLQEVYRFDGREGRRLTDFNEEMHAARQAGTLRHHVLTDREGVKFDGWVLLPPGYAPGKKYPAILNIHGGPKIAYGEIFSHEMEAWAAAGYCVLYCNPRGSDGKGDGFSALRGRYGTIDYENLMQFVDAMLDAYPAINPRRLGVTGGSYGGFMTNWIIGHTTRFAAAAAQRGISNWTSYMIGDIGYFFNDYDMLASPWSDPRKLWDSSPLKYADRVKTPTIFIHADRDFRTCLPEAVQMYTALKLHGVETRLCVFPGDGHGMSRNGKPDNRENRLREILNWMDRYLK